MATRCSNSSECSEPAAAAGAALRIGLTGGIGSGKSTVAALLAAQGAGLIDADAISRRLTGAGGAALEPIAAAFGAGLVGADGVLDRAALRRRVFADPPARARLEAILHPLIRAESRRQEAALAGACPYLLFDIPLLVETGGRQRPLDRVLVVDCPVDLQRRRAMQRSGLSAAEVDAIIAGQATRRARLDAADDVLFNADSLPALDARAAALHAMYRDLASARRGPRHG
jgi:dephospho-CoA kinase